MGSYCWKYVFIFLGLAFELCICSQMWPFFSENCFYLSIFLSGCRCLLNHHFVITWLTSSEWTGYVMSLSIVMYRHGSQWIIISTLLLPRLTADTWICMWFTQTWFIWIWLFSSSLFHHYLTGSEWTWVSFTVMILVFSLLAFFF